MQKDKILGYVKKYTRKEQISAFIGIVIVIILFLVVSYLVQNRINLERIKTLTDGGLVSMFVYIVILILATLTPVSAIPLLPLASGIWGWFLTGILNIIGWAIGSVFAFVLARKYGSPLVHKFISIEEIARYEKLISEENIFWSIVFLRVSVPVDILSYVLGLFSHIRLRTYVFATIIGITPLAFVFAYAGTLTLKYQLITFIIAVVILLTGLKIRQIYMIKRKLKQNLQNIEEDIKNVEIEKALPIVPSLQEVKEAVKEKK